jgi:hypothetical protein
LDRNLFFSIRIFIELNFITVDMVILNGNLLHQFFRVSSLNFIVSLKDFIIICFQQACELSHWSGLVIRIFSMPSVSKVWYNCLWFITVYSHYLVVIHYINLVHLYWITILCVPLWSYYVVIFNQSSIVH